MRYRKMNMAAGTSLLELLFPLVKHLNWVPCLKTEYKDDMPAQEPCGSEQSEVTSADGCNLRHLVD
jgi:hypothetical protein